MDEDTLTAELLADAKPVDVGDSGLKTLSDMVMKAKEIEAYIEKCARLQKQAAEKLLAYKTKHIPELMLELGQNYLVVDDTEVSLSEELYISIPKATENECYTWLRDNEHGDIIKNEVKVRFGKEQDNAAIDLMETLKERGLDFDKKESVHAGTLRKFAKEMDDQGEELPDDIFTIFRCTEAKFKTKKGK